MQRRGGDARLGLRGGGPCSRARSRALQHTATTQEQRERESGRRKEGGGEEGERSCSEDSSEAGGPTRGAAEDEGEGRHSSEGRCLREAQRKTRGRRAARKAEERGEEGSGAARAISEQNTQANILHTPEQQRYVGQHRPIITRRQRNKRRKVKKSEQEQCPRNGGLQPRGPTQGAEPHSDGGATSEAEREPNKGEKRRDEGETRR